MILLTVIMMMPMIRLILRTIELIFQIFFLQALNSIPTSLFGFDIYFGIFRIIQPLMCICHITHDFNLKHEIKSNFGFYKINSKWSNNKIGIQHITLVLYFILSMYYISFKFKHFIVLLRCFKFPRYIRCNKSSYFDNVDFLLSLQFLI